MVVYGSEWEDIAYFSDFNKAKTKLIVQCSDMNANPILYVYTDASGVYMRQKQYFVVDKKQLADGKLQTWSMQMLIDRCVIPVL